MFDLPRKTYTVASTGHTYEYIRIEAANATKSTILFLHGFPAIASGWHHQIKYFADLGHRIIAPDLLGFGGTSNPESASEYRSNILIEDTIAVLDHEKIGRFHGVGHDAGTYVLSRLYNYHPARLLSMTFIAVPYGAPGTHYDLEAMNQLTKKLIGFEKFAYMYFLSSDRSPELIEQHLASFLNVAYHKNVDIKADSFYPPGKLQAWLEADRNDEQVLLSPEESTRWLEAFRKSGFRGATNGYRVMAENLNEEHEKADLAAGKLTTKIEIPVLAIESTPDKASLPGFMEGAIKPYATAQLTTKTVESQGHYPHIVSKEEVNQAVHEFLSRIDS
ncbi:uncharacterized protein HMPREF1541_07546 [Cyphellophora europaea CBS 101466]|uniref:AB hydrolase-1 domain-containing protein n=1 Tax=Cyphellophora europaea (strain CBS 101466) TaxID=1220924 RepID=W2RQF0_CYPE1|nr:uncharacterized protein HMPREF1541_07546 [Cyphellophora europaea CBS 101466]ETN37923.1 hypothetical protein HMPREF1541_07546 [Cyphellophora europaea CBS 101466]